MYMNHGIFTFIDNFLRIVINIKLIDKITDDKYGNIYISI